MIKITKDDDGKITWCSRQEGKPPQLKTYLTTRAGVTWPKPSVDVPGYYCILGIEDRSALSNKKPLVVLNEGESPDRDPFFEKLTLNTNRWHCDQVYADLSKKVDNWHGALYQFVRNRNIDGVTLFDSSEFTDFEEGITLIRQKIDDDSLQIPESVLRSQLAGVTPESIKNLEENFYAVAALIRVLSSFEVYPFRKPKKSRHTASLGNWQRMLRDTGFNKDSDDYRQEWYVPDD